MTTRASSTGLTREYLEGISNVAGVAIQNLVAADINGRETTCSHELFSSKQSLIVTRN